MTADADHDEHDEDRPAPTPEATDRAARAKDRPAPAPERRISWGAPPPDPERTWPTATIAATPATRIPAGSGGRPEPTFRPVPTAPSASERVAAPAPPPPARPAPERSRPKGEPDGLRDPGGWSKGWPDELPPVAGAASTPEAPDPETAPAPEEPTAAAPEASPPDEAAPTPEPGPAPVASSAPAPPAAPARPASITDLAQQLAAIQQQLSDGRPAPASGGAVRSSELERRAAERADATVSRLSQQFATLQAQLGSVGDQLAGVSAGPAATDPRAAERTAAAVTELSQQLAATQAQVASLAAQLTTLAHRVTYDLERAGQTIVERVLRDLPTQVAALVGPAIDDLADQVEADGTRITEAVERGLGTRLGTVAEVVDGLPLANAELLGAVRGIEADLEDRFGRLANRLGDQVTAFEEANAAELARLRDHIFDLAEGQAGAAADREIIDRMAGQVERLVQGNVAADTTEAVEVLVAEHLEVLRDELETRDTELGARVDAALVDQVEALDALVAERLGEAIAEQATATDARFDDLLAATTSAETSTGEQLVALLAAVTELQEAQAHVASAAEVGGDDGGGLAAVQEELKALRRRITLRLEGDVASGLTEEQVADLAAQIAERLTPARPVKAAGPARAPLTAKQA